LSQDKIFGLFTDVINSINDYKYIEWSKVPENIESMSDQIEAFALRCRKMPRKLREWDAYLQLKQEIEDFQNVLPLLQELSKKSIKDRHWAEVMELTGTEFDIHSADFKLQTLLDANIGEHLLLFFSILSNLTLPHTSTPKSLSRMISRRSQRVLISN
jgi:dynein heavy chain